MCSSDCRCLGEDEIKKDPIQMRRARDLGSVLVLSGYHAVTSLYTKIAAITEELKSLNLRMAGEMIVGGIAQIGFEYGLRDRSR